MKSGVKRKLKSILCIFMCISFMSLMSGCDVPDEAVIGIDTVMWNRAGDNLNMAHNLMNAGFLTEDEYNSLDAAIHTNIERILQQLKNDGDVNATGNILLNAVTDWTCVPDCEETNPSDPVTGVPAESNSAFNTSFLANWMGGNGFDSGVLVRQENAIIKPIVVIDEATAQSINARFHYPMYILNENVQLDKAVAAINQATSGSTVDVSLLSSYFHLLTDENGDPVSLIDSNDPTKQLVQTTYNEGGRVDKDNKVINPLGDGIKWGLYTSHQDGMLSDCNWGLLDIYDNYTGELGKDLILTQHGYPTMAIRLVEFNQVAYDYVMGKLNLADQKYLVTTTGTEGRVYVMEYPVGYISKVEYDSTTKAYDSHIMQSEMSVNLRSGKIYSNTTNPVEMSTIDPYLQLSGGSPDTSSFIIDGVTGIGQASDGCFNLTFGDTNAKASVARIVLRDYLELSYAPDVIPNERFVAYGRKIRIDKLRGSAASPMAYYINKDGTRPMNPDGTPASTTLYVSDFSSIISSTSGNKFYLKYIPSSTAESVMSQTDLTKFETDLDALADYDDTKVENLQKASTTKISPTIRFPGSQIDKVDYRAGVYDEKQIFYGMFVSKDYTSSGLLNWLTSTDSVQSLRSWITWLKEHRYNYPLDVNKAVEFLKKSYKFELTQSGIIILDLDTIAKIQQGYDEDTSLGRTHTFRTIFKVLGYILIGYAALMLGCWTLDTTVDLGINSLEKITFGRLVAIKDEDEMPQQDTQSKSYIGFQPIIKSCLVVAVLGIVLVFVDVVSIVGFLVGILSGVANAIGEFIGGL